MMMMMIIIMIYPLLSETCWSTFKYFIILIVSIYYILRISWIIKGKAVPLQAWSGPEGSRKFKFRDFMTTAQDGGKVVSLTHRPPLPPRNAPGTHFC